MSLAKVLFGGVLLGLAVLVAGQGYGVGDSYLGFDPYTDSKFKSAPVHPTRWKLSGTNGKLTGDPTTMNRFCYNNPVDNCLHDVGATFTLDVDAEANTGTILIEFEHNNLNLSAYNDTNSPLCEDSGGSPTPCIPAPLMGRSGKFSIEMNSFSQMPFELFKEGGIAENVIIHGPKAPVFPAVHAFLGTWGSGVFKQDGVDLFPNGQKRIMTHTMLTERVYSEDDYVVHGATYPAGSSYTSRADTDPLAAEETCDSSIYMGMMAPSNKGDGCSFPNSNIAPAEFHANFRLFLPGSSTPMDNPTWVHLVWHDISDNSDFPDPSAGGFDPTYAIVGGVLGAIIIAAVVLFVVNKNASDAGRGAKLSV